MSLKVRLQYFSNFSPVDERKKLSNYPKLIELSLSDFQVLNHPLLMNFFLCFWGRRGMISLVFFIYLPSCLADFFCSFLWKSLKPWALSFSTSLGLLTINGDGFLDCLPEYHLTYSSFAMNFYCMLRKDLQNPIAFPLNTLLNWSSLNKTNNRSL